PIVLGLVRAAILSGCWDTAAERVAQARRLAEEAGDDELGVRALALAAHVALGLALRTPAGGPAAGGAAGDLGEPVALAGEALAAAERMGLPEVACEALEVIGREARPRDLATAEAAFQQALEIAERHELTLWRVRALHEVATIDLLRGHRTERLVEARAAAVQAGALATATMMDLQMAKAFLARFEPDRCLETARRCEAASRRYGLDTLAQAVVTQACLLAQLGREQEMEERIAEALAAADGDPDVLMVAWGQGHAFRSLVREDFDRALADLDRAMELARSVPGSPTRPYRGLWALLRVILRSDGEAALAELRASGATGNHAIAGYVGLADAVLLGRAGRPRQAEAAFADADAMLHELRWFSHHARRLVAAPAIEDGWGAPAAWLREALEFFTGFGAGRVASACRALLRKAGASVPRRLDASAAVPERLRALGVTGREMEVLTLVAEGLSNARIGERLFLSPRTVERHVGSLLARTGAANRTELAAFAAAPARSP
ncbi:MAG TPA: helix-turn-helix transcriptional regulator, partial [Actinomycetes bacterium]|nr:helix-turn-helix transcriptional regulator [Actinomycetes bacterium]